MQPGVVLIRATQFGDGELDVASAFSDRRLDPASALLRLPPTSGLSSVQTCPSRTKPAHILQSWGDCATLLPMLAQQPRLQYSCAFSFVYNSAALVRCQVRIVLSFPLRGNSQSFTGFLISEILGWNHAGVFQFLTTLPFTSLGLVLYHISPLDSFYDLHLIRLIYTMLTCLLGQTPSALAGIGG